MPQFPSKLAPWDLTQFSQLPSAAPSYFPESHQQSETSFLLKVILVLGKARNLRVPNLGCRGPESPGWFDILLKNSSWDMMQEWACCHDEAANHQLLVAADFWIIRSFQGRMLKVNAKSDAHLMLSSCAQSFWMRWPHSAHAHSTASIAPTD